MHDYSQEVIKIECFSSDCDNVTNLIEFSMYDSKDDFVQKIIVNFGFSMHDYSRDIMLATSQEMIEMRMALSAAETKANALNLQVTKYTDLAHRLFLV